MAAAGQFLALVHFVASAALSGCGDSPRSTKTIVSPTGQFEIDLAGAWRFDGVTEATPPEQWLRIWIKSETEKVDFAARGRLFGGVIPANRPVNTLADLQRYVPRRSLRRLSEEATRSAMSFTNDDYRMTLFDNGAVGYAASRDAPGQTESTYVLMMFRGHEYLVADMLIPAAYTPRSAEDYANATIRDLEGRVRLAAPEVAAQKAPGGG